MLGTEINASSPFEFTNVCIALQINTVSELKQKYLKKIENNNEKIIKKII